MAKAVLKALFEGHSRGGAANTGATKSDKQAPIRCVKIDDFDAPLVRSNVGPHPIDGAFDAVEQVVGFG